MEKNIQWYRDVGRWVRFIEYENEGPTSSDDTAGEHDDQVSPVISVHFLRGVAHNIFCAKPQAAEDNAM